MALSTTSTTKFAAVGRNDTAERGERATGSRYEILERLGSGGMGVVFRVFDRVARETRALKRVRAEGEHQHRLLEAFEREYQVLASLDHPRIIRVYDYGVDAEGPYYTMELVEGQDMRSAAPLPYKQVCACLRDVATSLALLHARQLLHRDLSPGNVRMTRDGHCKLLDFGALSAFGPSMLIVGTTPMIAPEVLDGAALDQRVDLYALGALAYWLLTGTHAYAARKPAELRECWRKPAGPPSAIVSDIPAALDALVMGLLRADPRARPETAAEVIAKLQVIAELPEEAVEDSERLAQSFLLSPRFTGRTPELAELTARLAAARGANGASIVVQAAAGMGRTRILDEVAVRASVADALVLRADASMARQLHGTARALALRAFDAAPELAFELARDHRASLVALGREVAHRCAGSPSRPPLPVSLSSEAQRPLESFFLELSLRKPLVILVDNVEYADDASTGMLAALASQAARHALLLVTTERARPDAPASIAVTTLRGHSSSLALAGMSDRETVELVRSLFGDAPHAERFGEWLYARTAGTPLYAIEICRQLAGKGVIRYAAGLWTLPKERPEARLPAALGEAMALRLTRLGEPARRLAECLSLQLEPPDRELSRLLSNPEDPGVSLELLAELTRGDVLRPSEGGYRFSSTAIRDALLAGMDDLTLQSNHRRLGEALAELAGANNHALQLQAGWHLIQGDDGPRGAEMIAAVSADGVGVLRLIANEHRAGAILEAALLVYQRQRSSLYKRLPLLAALAYAGYYEDRTWGERYGDQALDALEDLSGVRTARRLRRWLGRWPSLLVGLSLAAVRFWLTPRRDRGYAFSRMYVQLCAAVTTLTGAAALSLDSERAGRLAEVLEPFSVLPERLTPAGVYEFCRSLQQIGLENQPAATASFERLLARLRDPRNFPTLRAETRVAYAAALEFARGAFAIFRADGRVALESAAYLDSTGLKLYAMIASQLRCLYYSNRGELAKAAPHRAQVELHAAQFGSAWQVETWEAPALIALHSNDASDLVGATRIVHRMDVLSQRVPSMRRYQRLATHALMLARGVPRFVESVALEYSAVAPRSFIGWATAMGQVARAYNELGDHAKAKQICERALIHVTDADREYVTLFLMLDIQLAIAEAGCGDSASGRGRLDALIKRFAVCDHPLLHGLLHEARARICWAAGETEGYAHSLAQVEHYFRLTEAPSLIAKCVRLALLSKPRVPANSQLDDTDPRIRARALQQFDVVSELETVAAPLGRPRT